MQGGRLYVVYPQACASMLPLPPGTTMIGREPPALVVAQATVSRSHFELQISHPTSVGRDLGSHNGSWVNGLAASALPRPLADGDVLRLAEVVAVLELAVPESMPSSRVSVDAVPGSSSAAELLRRRIEAAAADPSPVLLVGETGTGKEWVARELHRLSGRRGPFVVTNCAALSASLVESQLFGHERGAFTGAAATQPGLFRAAEGGTLFLDEIGEIPVELQAKLLRAVELGEVTPLGSTGHTTVNTRIIAATNRDLAAEVEEGRFRRDLYARLSLAVVRLPPLRQRRADILGWIERLHERWQSSRTGKTCALELSAEAVEAILLDEWPDNLRGLDRLVHDLSAREPGLVSGSALPEWLRQRAVPQVHLASAEHSEAHLPPRARPDRNALVAVLRAHAWNISAVAAHFGRERRQVYRWIDHYGIERDS